MAQKQPTKAKKRRQHQAERDAEREAELDAERAQQGESEQAVEDRKLREMLTPLGLTIRAIQVIVPWPESILHATASVNTFVLVQHTLNDHSTCANAMCHYSPTEHCSRSFGYLSGATEQAPA